MSTHNLSGIIFFAHGKRFKNLIQFLWDFLDKIIGFKTQLKWILFFSGQDKKSLNLIQVDPYSFDNTRRFHTLQVESYLIYLFNQYLLDIICEIFDQVFLLRQTKKTLNLANFKAIKHYNKEQKWKGKITGHVSYQNKPFRGQGPLSCEK